MAYMMSMGEANRRITEYLNKFSDAVSYQDGNTLQRLLSFSSESPSLLSLADALNLTQVSSILFILLQPPPPTPKFEISKLFSDFRIRVLTVWLKEFLIFPRFEIMNLFNFLNHGFEFLS